MNTHMGLIMTAIMWCICILFGGSIAYLNIRGDIEDDSIIEEITEEVIDELIGVSIDLSPFSDDPS